MLSFIDSPQFHEILGKFKVILLKLFIAHNSTQYFPTTPITLLEPSELEISESYVVQEHGAPNL